MPSPHSNVRAHGTLCLGLVLALGCTGGCGSKPEGLGSPEVPEHLRESQPDAPSTEAEPPEAAPSYVDVDLDEHGITASLRAPGKVEINATDDGVELVSEEGFHLFVGRGSLDMTRERAELVRAFGNNFVQFLEDEPNLAVWEIRSPTGNRFHFFATHGSGERGYHCKTPPRGVDSPQLVRMLVDVCGNAHDSASE